jgi:hypothetical protein
LKKPAWKGIEKAIAESQFGAASASNVGHNFFRGSKGPKNADRSPLNSLPVDKETTKRTPTDIPVRMRRDLPIVRTNPTREDFRASFDKGFVN